MNRAMNRRNRLSLTPCPLCRNLERSPRDQRIAFDLDRTQLERMAGSKCGTCALLYSGIAHIAATAAGLSWVRMVSIWGDVVGSEDTLEAELYFQDIGSTLKMQFFVTPGALSPWKAIKSLPRVAGNTGSDDSIAWVAQAVRRCVKTHKKCKSHRPNLPKRILYLGDSDHPEKVRLVETGRKPGRYACLSHCRSPKDAIQTTKANLASHLQRIPWQTIPKTFQDAITVTRKLGLRYLWIDSLCVVQDDKKDRLEESGNMASIFQDSLICLAATASRDDKTGCFSLNSLLPSGDFSLKTPTRPFDVYVREKLPHWDAADPATFASTYPLMTQAWAYQERLLPPRVLHFCQRELVWECLEETTCQCTNFKPKSQPKLEHVSRLQEIHRSLSTIDAANKEIEEPPMITERRRSSRLIMPPSPQSRRTSLAADLLSQIWVQPNWGSPQLPSKFVPRSREPREVREVRDFRRSSEVQEVHEISEETGMKEAQRLRRDLEAQRSLALHKANWHNIVKEYTKLALVNEADRLPAVGGLARQTQNSRTGDYLAGLWADSLVEDMLWRVERLEPNLPSGRRPSTTRAPTWSWASVNAAIAYDGRGWKPDLRVVNWVCTPVPGGNTYGEIAAGFLTLEGVIRKAKVVYVSSSNGEQDPTRYQLVGAKHIFDFNADYCLSLISDHYVHDSAMVYCLRAARSNMSTAWIILRRHTSDKMAFERIGIIECPFSVARGGPMGEVFEIDKEFGRVSRRITLH